MEEQTKGMDWWIASSSAVIQALLWFAVVKKGVIKIWQWGPNVIKQIWQAVHLIFKEYPELSSGEQKPMFQALLKSKK